MNTFVIKEPDAEPITCIHSHDRLCFFMWILLVPRLAPLFFIFEGFRLLAKRNVILNLRLTPLRHFSIIDERKITEYASAFSGAVAASFVGALWEVSGNNPDTLDRLKAILGNLYEQGKESEAVEVLHILYDALGLAFPDEISVFCSSAEARSCFLLELLMDIDDIVQELLM